jgi:hypothetical protein
MQTVLGESVAIASESRYMGVFPGHDRTKDSTIGESQAQVRRGDRGGTAIGGRHDGDGSRTDYTNH